MGQARDGANFLLLRHLFPILMAQLSQLFQAKVLDTPRVVLAVRQNTIQTCTKTCFLLKFRSPQSLNSRTYHLSYQPYRHFPLTYNHSHPSFVQRRSNTSLGFSCKCFFGKQLLIDLVRTIRPPNQPEANNFRSSAGTGLRKAFHISYAQVLTNAVCSHCTA